MNNKGLIIFYRIILIITGILAGIFLYLRIRLLRTGYNSKEFGDAVTMVFNIYKWFGYAAFFLTLLTLKSTSKWASLWRSTVMMCTAISILAYDRTLADASATKQDKASMVFLADIMALYCISYIFTSIGVIRKTLKNK